MNILSVLELLTKHTQYNLGSLLPQAMVNIFESGFYTLMANGSAAGCRHDGHLQVVRLHVHECLLLVRAVVCECCFWALQGFSLATLCGSL